MRPEQTDNAHPSAPRGVAVLVASRNGGSTVGATIASVSSSAHVYVADDASADDTSAQARAAGARVLRMDENLGKAAAVRALLDEPWAELDGRRIPEAYEHCLILDDDTVASAGYVEALSAALRDDPGIGAVEGEARVPWPPTHRWNAWLAVRTVGIWSAQAVTQRLQSRWRSRTWITGALCMYPAGVLDAVVRPQPMFVTEDLDWCWQISRRGLGDVRYLHGTVAWWQQPADLRSLYRQHLRWSWGTWQVTAEHQMGRHMTRRDMWGIWRQLSLIMSTIWPVFIVVWSLQHDVDLMIPLAVYAAFRFANAALAAAATRRPRLLVLWPALLVYDLMWKVVTVHGFVRAVRQPRVRRATWVSPTRIIDAGAPETAAPPTSMLTTASDTAAVTGATPPTTPAAPSG